MRSLFFVLVVSTLTGCGGSSASSTETTNGSTANTQASSGGEAETLALSDFSAQVAAGALPQVCGDTSSFLRRCFTVNEAQCGEGFQAMMIGCAQHGAELGLPETVNESTAESTARTLAQCAMQAYSVALNQAGAMLQTPECQPPAN